MGLALSMPSPKGGHMEATWRAALWPQFGAAIDMLDNAVAACPDTLWSERIWPMPADHLQAPESSQFWYLTYHCLLWLDLYLTALPETQFAPPARYPPAPATARRWAYPIFALRERPCRTGASAPRRDSDRD